MIHRYSPGSSVFYQPSHGQAAARGPYKIVQRLPIENDNRVAYRIKNVAETFERIAEEHQLSRTE